MTQIDKNSLINIGKITRLDFFEKLTLRHYVYLESLLYLYKINLYRSVKGNFYRKLYIQILCI